MSLTQILEIIKEAGEKLVQEEDTKEAEEDLDDVNSQQLRSIDAGNYEVDDRDWIIMNFSTQELNDAANEGYGKMLMSEK